MRTIREPVNQRIKPCTARIPFTPSSPPQPKSTQRYRVPAWGKMPDGSEEGNYFYNREVVELWRETTEVDLRVAIREKNGVLGEYKLVLTGYIAEPVWVLPTPTYLKYQCMFDRGLVYYTPVPLSIDVLTIETALEIVGAVWVQA